MCGDLELQGTEKKVGNKQAANSFHCFSLQPLQQWQLPWNLMSSMSFMLNR